MNFKYIISFTLVLSLLFFACKHKNSGPFNYELIKKKLTLTDEETKKFDDIIDVHTAQLINNFKNSEKSTPEKMKVAKQISAKQDSLVKLLLPDKKFQVYKTEITIERKGRDRHNMNLIKNQLNLDSIQTQKYEAANEAFYTTLINNHDYYHGKPNVYLQYYKEIDVNRQQVFEKILNKNQLNIYNTLKAEYKIGKSEH